MTSRQKQQLGGLLIALMGAGFTIWTWFTALTKGYYYRKTSMFFPAALVLGLGLLIFPGYKEERTAKGEDISQLSGLQLLTPRWWVILVLALAAGGINFYLLTLK